MPWINLTIRRGALPKPVQHALMAKLTEVLMWWEKVPDTPRARSIMKAGSMRPTKTRTIAAGCSFSNSRSWGQTVGRSTGDVVILAFPKTCHESAAPVIALGPRWQAYSFTTQSMNTRTRRLSWRFRGYRT
jgi:hypothetical protein